MITANLKKKPLLFLVCVLVLTSMACSFGSASTSTEALAIQESPTSESDDVESLLEDIQTQIGTFAFTVTEEEMTSYLTLKLSENQEAPEVENLSVKFQDNQITISGDVYLESLGIKVPVELGILAKVDAEGLLYFELVSVEVANMSLPQAIEESLSAAFTDLMNSNFASYLNGFKIDTVYINGGLLTISGNKR